MDLKYSGEFLKKKEKNLEGSKRGQKGGESEAKVYEKFDGK